MKILVLLVFFNVVVFANSINNIEYFKSLLRRNDIEFEIKSTKNWLKLMNNKEKIHDLELDFNASEINMSIKVLQRHVKNRINRVRGMK